MNVHNREVPPDTHNIAVLAAPQRHREDHNYYKQVSLTNLCVNMCELKLFICVTYLRAFNPGITLVLSNSYRGEKFIVGKGREREGEGVGID